MNEELRELLERAKGVVMTEAELHEHRIAMAVANGVLSDDRVTTEAMRATVTVAVASGAMRADGC